MNQKEFILTLSCQDQVGIVAAVTGMLAENNLFILELSQFSDPTTLQFFMRIDFRAQKEELCEAALQNLMEPIAKKFNMDFKLHDKTYRPKVLILVSKLSHCLNDLLYRHSKGALKMDIPVIASNHGDLKELAEKYGIPFIHLKAEREQKLLELIQKHEIDLVVLARYMQILSSKMCEEMEGKIINIHHSFLPSFKGAKPYHQAYDRGVKLIGATAHFVTEDLDEGPIIEQETVRVRHDHSPQELVKRGCDVECLVLSRAVKLQIEQRVFLNKNKTIVFD